MVNHQISIVESSLGITIMEKTRFRRWAIVVCQLQKLTSTRNVKIHIWQIVEVGTGTRPFRNKFQKALN
jgi:hypothetical protein